MRRLGVLVLLTACGAPTRPGSTSTPRRPSEESARAPVSAPEVVPRREERADPTPEPTRWPPKTPPRVDTDWCTDAVSGLDDSACYVLPESPTTTLLIYLHGIVPPQKESVQKTTYQAIVARASRRAGVAALMPRGQRGLAPKGNEGWWGWPTSLEQYRRYSQPLVEKLGVERARLETATGTTFTRIYLAGSSSGAWFTAALALYGGMAADGYAATSGGASWGSDELEHLAPKPFYIGYGTHDSVAKGAQGLAARLKSAGWPVRIAAHPVGHGAHEIYLEEAFAFWNAR